MSTLNQFYREDSGTNTVLSIAEFMHTSSGTPASGLGAAIKIGAENSAGTAMAAAEYQGYLTTVTNGAEVSSAMIKVLKAGAAVNGLGIHGAGYNSGVLGLAVVINAAVNPGIYVDATNGSNTAAKVIVDCAADTSYGKFQFRVAGTKKFEWAVQGNDSTNIKLFYSDSDTLCATLSDSGALTLVGACASTGFTATATGIATQFLSKRSDNTAGARTGPFLSQGVNSTPAYVTYGAVYGRSDVLTAGAEDGSLQFYTMRSGTLTLAATFDKNGQLTTVAGIVATTGSFSDNVTMNGSANIMGNASTDAFTFTGRCVLRSVTDAGPMTATGGTQCEIVFNTSDSKFYGCTVTHASAATWVALN